MDKRQRVYIGNLPADATRSHLLSVLPPGFDESKLEIKRNYDIDKNVTSSFAFVDVAGGKGEAAGWCREASSKSLGGYTLQVQFAKTNFLDRLREEVRGGHKNKPENLVHRKHDTRLPPSRSVKFDSDGELSGSEEQFISESCASVDKSVNTGNHLFDNVGQMENLDFDEDYGVKGAEKSPAKKKRLSDETTKEKAELKRIESLKEKASMKEQQRKIIKMAIKSGVAAKKVVFRDSEEEERNSDGAEEVSDEEQERGDRRRLFDESESEDDFKLNFNDDKRRTKLIKTKVSSTDERFRLDKRFLDKDEDVDEEATEQDKLLDIADSIILKDPTASKTKIGKNKRSLWSTDDVPKRFNPLEKTHSSLLIRDETDVLAEEAVKTDKPGRVRPFHVTKDRFYEVKDDLAQTFNKESNASSGGFSLLGMFGDVPQQTQQTTGQDQDKRINKLKNPLDVTTNHFFNVDVESDAEDETSRKEGGTTAGRSLYEPLFLPLDDQRVVEALQFFNTPLPDRKISHPVLSRNLRKIVKKKHLSNLHRNRPFKKKLGSLRRNYKHTT